MRSEGAKPRGSVISSAIAAILDRTPGSWVPRDCRVKMADRMSLIVSSSASTA